MDSFPLFKIFGVGGWFGEREWRQRGQLSFHKSLGERFWSVWKEVREGNIVWLGCRERCLCKGLDGEPPPLACHASGGQRLRRSSADLQVGWQKRWTTRFCMLLLSLLETSPTFRSLWIMKQVGIFNAHSPPIGKGLKSHSSSEFTFLD